MKESTEMDVWTSVKLFIKHLNFSFEKSPERFSLNSFHCDAFAASGSMLTVAGSPGATKPSSGG